MITHPTKPDAIRDWRTDDFDFALPPGCIAQTAVEPRDAARLLHIASSGLADHYVHNLPDILKSGDVLVINNTKVIPARLFGKRGAVAIEVLLHQRQSSDKWSAFARPGKRLSIDDAIIFADDFHATVLQKHDDGQIDIRFNVADADLMLALHRYGEPPLPPYIKRDKGEARKDEARYQTVYADPAGSVAAPTAGLHFTPELLDKLRAKGHEILTVTLHVGAGTFQPVKVDHVRAHKMHSEWGEVTTDTAARLNNAKSEGRRIVAVGTTSLRLLESAVDEQGQITPYAAMTDIFITPGYKFRVVDALMTNFHLPKSTLFMLVSAFAGYDRMRAAYDYAIKNKYRFYSFGDASFLEKQA
jgi:S-adenosylmethionine:tRNA ribosyltransferase-isomerase